MNVFSSAIYLTVMVMFFSFLFLTQAEARISVSVGTGYLAGDTQYQVGGQEITAMGVDNLQFPLSELKFPLDAFMLKGIVSVDFGDRWTLMASAATNINDDTGKMENSDWGIVSGDPHSLDVYSESDTDMDALLLEGKLTYMFYQTYYSLNRAHAMPSSDIRFSYTAGVGYKYQDLDFEVSNLDQWYPYNPALPHDQVSGLVLTYEAQYQIPYLELSMEMNVSKKFLLEIGAAYAPLVDFQDEDHHLLRDKVNIADHDWDGSAGFVRMKVRYNFTQYLYLECDGEIMKIESEGRSDAYFNGIWDHSIEHEVESKQYSAYISIGGVF